MDYDIAVVGAGPAGLSFARSLAGTDLRIALIERQNDEQLFEPEFDGRDIALTHLSVRILEEQGVWDRIDAAERHVIREARVLDGVSPFYLSFQAGNDTDHVLGHIVSNHVIRKALVEAARTLENVDLLTDLAVSSVEADEGKASVTLSDDRRIEARLVVAADSRYSETRRRAGIPASMQDFGRVCIVCRMEHEKPHRGIASECFRYGSTLAALPLADKQSSIVVTAPAAHCDELMAMDHERFAAVVCERLEHRYGTMQLITRRFAYPLVAVHADRFFADRLALIGDAAVGMHPVTAHGFNLGLSGQKILADGIAGARMRETDIGALSLLSGYERRHMRTTRPMYLGTNQIVKLFTDDRPHAKFARHVGLRLADAIPPIKRVIRNKLTDTSHRPGLLPLFFKSG